MGTHVNPSDSGRRVGLPPKVFHYTLDQISVMFDLTESNIKRYYLFYEGRSVGVQPKDKMLAVDISHADADKPDWRISEKELARWMRHKKIRYYERGFGK